MWDFEVQFRLQLGPIVWVTTAWDPRWRSKLPFFYQIQLTLKTTIFLSNSSYTQNYVSKLPNYVTRFPHFRRTLLALPCPGIETLHCSGFNLEPICGWYLETEVYSLGCIWVSLETSDKIGTIQRGLAWPLCKDDTHKSRLHLKRNQIHLTLKLT